jgi:hypothetical protein
MFKQIQTLTLALLLTSCTNSPTISDPGPVRRTVVPRDVMTFYKALEDDVLTYAERLATSTLHFEVEEESRIAYEEVLSWMSDWLWISRDDLESHIKWKVEKEDKLYFVPYVFETFRGDNPDVEYLEGNYLSYNGKRLRLKSKREIIENI